MKKIDLGQTLQLLGNLGVIIGILLLVLELRQNQEMMRAETRRAMTDGVIELMSMYSSDDEVAGIIRRGDAGEELTENEKSRYENLRFAGFRYFENVYYQYRVGLYDEIEYEAQKVSWRALYSSPGMAALWCSYAGLFSPDFSAEIDDVLTTHRCD